MELNIFERLSVTARNVIGITNVYTPQQYLIETFRIRNTFLKDFLSSNSEAVNAVKQIFILISTHNAIKEACEQTLRSGILLSYTASVVDDIERHVAVVMHYYDKTVKQYKDMEAWDNLRDIHYWNLYLLKDQLYLDAKNGTDVSKLDLYFPTLRESLRIINGDQSSFFENLIGMKLTINDRNCKSYIEFTYHEDNILFGEFSVRSPETLDISFISVL